MDPRLYLQRIGWQGKPGADLITLKKLQTAHLYTVPFENLSIHTGEWIRLDYDWLFEKIVRRRRGGFCYELNGLFGWLLSEIGYDVTLLSARVLSAGGAYGPEFDHLVLKVDLDDSWLVDVGFGRAFSEPLAIRTGEEQTQGNERFKITQEGEDYIYWRFDNEWLAGYRFSLKPRNLSDFSEMCRYHQKSSQSPFTEKWLATMLTENGRETLHQDGHDFRYIISDSSGKHERIIQGQENALILLEEIFGIPEDSLQPRHRKKRDR